LDEVVGKAIVDLAGPVEDIERTITDFNDGRFVGVQSLRSIHLADGEDRVVLAFVPASEVGGLGRDPAGPGWT
jgi:hypothetical protein